MTAAQVSLPTAQGQASPTSGAPRRMVVRYDSRLLGTGDPTPSGAMLSPVNTGIREAASPNPFNVQTSPAHELRRLGSRLSPGEPSTSGTVAQPANLIAYEASPTSASSLSASPVPQQNVIAGGRRRMIHRSVTTPLQLIPCEQPSTEAEPPDELQKPMVGRPRAQTQDLSLAVTVIAPGAGTGVNKVVFNKLEHQHGYKVMIQGQSRAPYDKYPPGWPTGGPPPNLYTFAQDLLAKGVVEQAQCFVFGSRGGQVVLPAFWAAKGAAVGPAVVINGGCARDDCIPPAGCGDITSLWPKSAVTFLLIGGKDNFRQNKSLEDYLAMTLRYVPRENMTTAVLFLDDMAHMPQTEMLDAILKHMLSAVVQWKGSTTWASQSHPAEAAKLVPKEEMEAIVKKLVNLGWEGRLLHKTAQDTWNEASFGRDGVSQKSRIS